MWVERIIYCHSTKMQCTPVTTKSELLIQLQLCSGRKTPVKGVPWDHYRLQALETRFFGIKATHLQTMFLLAVSNWP